MLVSNIDYDEYTGRIAVGKIQRGMIKTNMQLAVCKADGSVARGKATKLYTFEGLNRGLPMRSAREMSLPFLELRI